MSSARAKKAAAAHRVIASAAFHQHDAAQPALQVPTFQFGSPAQCKVEPNADHPASDQVFATVAALQHLCDEHDMDHVSPPPRSGRCFTARCRIPSVATMKHP
jgi:hypothetical protein